MIVVMKCKWLMKNRQVGCYGVSDTNGCLKQIYLSKEFTKPMSICVTVMFRLFQNFFKVS